jgi:hypothetical protein
LGIQRRKKETLSELMITLRKDALKIMPWNIRQTKLNHVDYENLRPAMLRRFVLKAGTGDFKIKMGEVRLIHRDCNGNVILPPSQEEARGRDSGGSGSGGMLK